MAASKINLLDYKFIKILGIGSSGFVGLYSGQDSVYAIKFIVAPILSPDIQREIKILTILNNEGFPVPRIYNHDFILSTSDLIESLGSYSNLVRPDFKYFAIIMEYIDGINLEDLLNLDDPSILNIAIWLFDILGELHKINIVHRDIKPSNIILTSNKTLYLVDFGLACSTRDPSILCPHLISLLEQQAVDG